MKNTIIKTISAVTVIVLMMLMLSSCGAPIIGHTGGFTGEPFWDYDYYWVETYDECVEAIERMKVHGSTFYETMLVSYEGDLFDMKYCIKVRDEEKEIMHPYEIFTFKFGAQKFDWKAEKVEIMCFAFLEDVTIDEILSSTNSKNRSNVWNFKSYKIIPNADYAKNNNFSYDGITIDSLELVEEWDHYTIYDYTLDGTSVLQIKFNSTKNEALGENEINAILGSIEVDMYKIMENNFVYEKPYSPN